MTLNYPSGFVPAGSTQPPEEVKEPKKKNKYNAIKVTVDNILFDSIRESERYLELKMLLRTGVIRDLELQVLYECVVKNVWICDYVADFLYVVTATGESVTEDSKGYRNRVYIMKKNLVLACFGITIVEV